MTRLEKLKGQSPPGVPAVSFLQAFETEVLERGKPEQGALLQRKAAFPPGQAGPDFDDVGETGPELAAGMKEDRPFGRKRECPLP